MDGYKAEFLCFGRFGVLLPRASGILDFNVLALFSLLVFVLFDCFCEF